MATHIYVCYHFCQRFLQNFDFGGVLTFVNANNNSLVNCWDEQQSSFDSKAIPRKKSILQFFKTNLKERKYLNRIQMSGQILEQLICTEVPCSCHDL